MQRFLLILSVLSFILVIPFTKVFAQAANCSCSGGTMCCAVLGGSSCLPSSACTPQTVCGPCTSAGVSYCDFPGGFSVTNCGTYHPPAPTAVPPTATPKPSVPTATPVPPASPNLTLSPNHGCLNTAINVTVNGISLHSGDLATGFFNNNGISSITAGAQVLQGFVPWNANSITIIPNQKMSYLGQGTSTDLNQSSNNLDYSQLLSPGSYPITFNFNGNSDVPANTNAEGTYAVDASCFPAITSNAPIPTATITPKPTCHNVQVCPTGPDGKVQLCTFQCE